MSWLFGCSHDRLSFPITSKGDRHPHVCCLSCAREFFYSWQQMKVTGPRVTLVAPPTSTEGIYEHAGEIFVSALFDLEEPR
jgi:hypothetical protein